ncbi:MAG: hypothetical protein NZ933_06535 [Bacteroidia bacterium]|nr:hypothetical protein [Bacteroidia bacterium]
MSITPRAYLWLTLGWAFGQLTGVINEYAAVTSFINLSTIQVDNGAIFAPGDRVLVYQAKGASISSINDASYGDILSIGGAGLFEFSRVQSVVGNTITLSCPLTRPFNTVDPTTARIQLIKVSYHPGDVSITGEVTALPWDGSKGGVVVIETEGTLTLNANISVTGQGFRGGIMSMNGGSTSACNTTTYHGQADDQAGRKGEGIAEWPAPAIDHLAYRGKLANGGGGGNNHNTGGGGGGNYGQGGQGGWTTCGSRFWCPGGDVTNSGYGIGGASLSAHLSSTNLRLFMGGGGGGGHRNNNQGGDGGRGGGIVIIRAATIQGGGFEIRAAGAQAIQTHPGCGGVQGAFSGNDGAGGGGAGGSIALFCNNYVGNLILDVRGADGQSASTHTCACSPDHGPGGGGGGGYVAFSSAIIPPGITVHTTGGQNGIEITPLGEGSPPNPPACAGNASQTNCIPSGPGRINRGATPGANGGVLTSISWNTYNTCPLAQVQLNHWHVSSLPDGTVRHKWKIITSHSLRALLTTFLNQKGEVYEISLGKDYEGENFHKLPSGIYKASLYASLSEGGLVLLEEKQFIHEAPLIWQNDELILWFPETTSFLLYDAKGQLIQADLLNAYTPYYLSTTSFPSGLYLVQIGSQVYRFAVSR